MHLWGGSLADRVAATGGRSAGFDYLRIGLAVAIVCWHSILLCYGGAVEQAIWRSAWRPLPSAILPVFFALSGFLVAGSLERCPTLISFFGLRILRILPALAVEITLSALLLGPLLTQVPLREYFASPIFHAYFLNILGDIQYTLPGLFPANPKPEIVNGQLWTIPFELQCYLALGLLGLIGAIRRRALLLGAMALLQAIAIWHAFSKTDPTGGAVTGSVLVMSFLAGVTLYVYRDRIPWSAPLGLAAALATAVLLSVPNGEYAVAFPAAYLTVYAGLLNPRKIPVIFKGDYSYGIYLYGFPLAQAFVSLGPGTRHWYWYMLAVLPACALVACISWTRVEKPALRLRRYLPGLEARAVARLAGLRPVAVMAGWRGLRPPVRGDGAAD